MLKSIFAIFSFLFLFVIKAQSLEVQESSNDGLLKSFTAKCANHETCLYSLILTSTGGSYSANVAITVDSAMPITQSFSIKSTEPGSINFEVNYNSNITIIFSGISAPSSFILFTVYNKPDGQGDVVINSKSLQYLVPNKCSAGSCSLNFGKSTIWASNVSAKVKVNGAVVATLNTATPSATISINPNDIISVEIVTDLLDPTIPDNLSVSAFFAGNIISNWFSNSYYTPMIFSATGCPITPPPINSPFGGPLIIMNQEEINTFATNIGTSFSTSWIPETETDSQLYNENRRRNSILL